MGGRRIESRGDVGCEEGREEEDELREFKRERELEKEDEGEGLVR